MIGQILRWCTGNRLFPYPEELPDFILPEAYITALNSGSNHPPKPNDSRRPSAAMEQDAPTTSSNSEDLEKMETALNAEMSDQATSTDHEDLEKIETAPNAESEDQDISFQRVVSRLETREWTEARIEAEFREEADRVVSRPIKPTKTENGVILVDWYTTDDPANPLNWSFGKKSWITFVICFYTFAVYASSAIYTSAEVLVIEHFGVTKLDASLPLSLYVLAYGIGPLIFSPLSEVPVIGRNPIYVTTVILFTAISVPTALTPTFAGLLVCRFLQGLFGSPCLATGAATLQDIWPFFQMVYALMAWVAAQFCGPALGPLLSGFAVTAKGWRWSLWEILWLISVPMVLMLTVVPETSTPNILMRRADRLRKLTGDDRLRSQAEIDQKNIKPMKLFLNALAKPMEITIKDPAIAFVNVYASIIYGIYYSFFEVFPLVYPPYYGFTVGTVGVVFTCILVSCLIGMSIYWAYARFYMIPDLMKNFAIRPQEARLVPALFACFGPTIGLFIFAWTADPRFPWIAPTIGIVLYGASVFVVSPGDKYYSKATAHMRLIRSFNAYLPTFPCPTHSMQPVSLLQTTSSGLLSRKEVYYSLDLFLETSE